MQTISQHEQVPAELAGTRLDQAAAQLFPDFSRSRLQSWIKSGELTVDGKAVKTRAKLMGGEQLRIEARLEEADHWQAQDIPLDVVYEDDSLLIINKPADFVVHPAAGNPDGTLLNALLHHVSDAATLPRGGIVHRLDKDTTGLLVVAKTLQAHTHLVSQLQARTMGREYEAIVTGVMTGGGKVDAPISRHAVQRIKMAVNNSGKEAVTHYQVKQRFRGHSHIKLKLETGRTHQIRVHMAHINYPILGDPVYGGRPKLPKACLPELQDALQNFKRQALHARRLTLVHPETEREMTWQVPVPEDMQYMLDMLGDDAVDWVN